MFRAIKSSTAFRASNWFASPSSSSASLRLFSSSAVSDLDSTVIVTKKCYDRIAAIQKNRANKEVFLRLSVEGGGCSGFQYVFSIENGTPGEDDRVYNKGELKVAVDESSFDLVQGATIDYESDMMRSAFVVVNNPQSETACGCGSSFAIKNFELNPALD